MEFLVNLLMGLIAIIVLFISLYLITAAVFIMYDVLRIHPYYCLGAIGFIFVYGIGDYIKNKQ